MVKKNVGRKRRNREDWIMDGVIYMVAVVILFMTLYPFYYVLILSFNEGVDASLGGIYWFPRKFTLSNYTRFFNDLKWLRALGISFLRTFIGTALGVTFTTLVAYALSFRELVGRKAYMTFVIICMYFSGGIIPYYALLRGLHLIDSFAVYVIPGMLNLFYITIGRTFFEDIPGSLRESAKIDGAGELKIFARIIVPISKPFMATLALFIGVGHWNNWYDSTFFIKTKALRTLPYLMMEIVNQFQTTNDLNAAAHQAAGTTSLSVQMAAMVISVVPIIFIYPYLQKYFVTGMMVGAVKE